MSQARDMAAAVEDMKQFVNSSETNLGFIAALSDWLQTMSDKEVSDYISSGDTRTKNELLEARRVFGQIQRKLTDLVGPENKERFNHARSVGNRY